MGEITHVDLGRLRDAADVVSSAASEVADMRWPELDSDALPGSAVSAIAAPDPVMNQVRGLVAGLRDWAAAARTSADAFERADVANGERLAPR